MYDECVQCGYCCTVRPCGFGVWNPERKACEYLTEDTRCERYEEIKKFEEGSKYPMFGCGCSSALFNDVREAKIKEIKDARKMG